MNDKYFIDSSDSANETNDPGTLPKNDAIISSPERDSSDSIGFSDTPSVQPARQVLDTSINANANSEIVTDSSPSVNSSIPSQAQRPVFSSNGESPEPPLRTNSDDDYPASPNGSDPSYSNSYSVGSDPSTVFQVTQRELSTLESARRFTFIGCAMSIVSLLFGGTMLSSISIVVAAIGFAKYDSVARKHADNPKAKRAIRRMGLIGLAICIGITVLNVVTMVVMYPQIVDFLRDGGFLNQGQSGSFVPGIGNAPSGGSSTWG